MDIEKKKYRLHFEFQISNQNTPHSTCSLISDWEFCVAHTDTTIEAVNSLIDFFFDTATVVIGAFFESVNVGGLSSYWNDSLQFIESVSILAEI